MLRIKRVYDAPEGEDGVRYLVERLWPRGMKKGDLMMDAWLKDVAPSQGLRRWYRHEPAKWDEFQHRYRSELDSNPSGWKPMVEASKRSNVTLLYSARDTNRNSAALLKSYLEERLSE